MGTCPPGGVWTPWDDRDNPAGSADNEERAYYTHGGTCATEGVPLAIQARIVGTHEPYTDSDDVITITPDRGLLCLNADQADGSCADYEVRYCCASGMEIRF